MFCSSCGSSASGRFCAACGSQILTPLPNQSATQPVANFSPQPTSYVAPGWNQAPGGLGYQSPTVPVGARSGTFHLISRLSALFLALGLFLYTFWPLWDAFIFFPLLTLDDWVVIAFSEHIWETAFGVIFFLVALFLSIASVAAWVRWIASWLINGVMFAIVVPLSSLARGDTDEYLPQQPIETLFEEYELLFGYSLGLPGIIWIVTWVASLILIQLAPLAATLAMLGATIQAKRLN